MRPINPHTRRVNNLSIQFDRARSEKLKQHIIAKIEEASIDEAVWDGENKDKGQS